MVALPRTVSQVWSEDSVSKARAITIREVAREAGVSLATVSRVVRDHDDVNEATRRRVQAVIDQLGYRPSHMARALVSGRSGLVALLVSDIANPFYPQLAHSIEREATRAGYGLVVCNTGDDPDETKRYLQRLLDHGVEALIHASVGLDGPLIAEAGQDIPVVYTNRRPALNDTAYVIADNLRGAEELTDHLLKLGHERIAFIGGPEFAANSSDREMGYAGAMEAAGRKSSRKRGSFTRDSGRMLATELLTARTRPSAIIGVNDLVAIGVMEAAQALGMRVPGDVAVAGFDNIELAASPLVSLTSVTQHIDRLGERAFQAVLTLLSRSRRLSPDNPQEVLPTELIVRSSTGG
jgi:DNA-binding LacI/PurR family transcriptional regulator